MRASTWVVTGLVAAVVGVGAGLLFIRPSHLVAAPPNAELAPATLVAYAEVNGLAGVWSQMTATESWRDLLDSKLLADLRGTPTGKAAADLSDRVEAKAGYALDARRTMHFAGRQVSFGLDAVPATGDPAWLLLAKLDVDALVAEMLRGERDWRGLHDEFDRRAGAMEFQVSRTSHRGRDVSTATRGTVTFHAALLGDTLAVSDSVDLLRRTIDVHEADGEGSLGRTARYRDEVAKLPKGALAHDWIDLDALRGARSALERWLNAHESKGFAAGAAGRILEGTSGSPALAVSVEVPEGDLYRVRWAHSRTGAELAGAPSPSELSAIVGGHPLTVELRDLGAVVAAWERSSLLRRTESGPIGEKIREWTESPEKLREAIREGPFAGLGDEDFEIDDPDSEPDEDEGDEGLLGGFDRFTSKIAFRMSGESVTQTFSGSGAIGLGPGEGDAPFGGTVAMSLGAQGYLAALAVEGAAVAMDRGVRRSDRDGAAVFSVRPDGDGPEIHWAHAGDVVVVASDRAGLDRALDAAKRPAAVPPPADAPMELPHGWFLRVRATGPDLVRWMERASGAGESADLARSMPDEFVGAVYAAPDLAWVEMRTVSRYGREIVPVDATGDPRTWAWLPDRTIGVAGCAVDLRRMLEEGRRLFPAEFGTSLDESLGEMRQEIGVDVERELLPALGPELAIAVVHARAPETDPPGWDSDLGAPPFLPGIVLSVETRDEALVQRAVDGIVAWIRRSFEQDGGSEEDLPFDVKEEQVDGCRVLRFALREPETPTLEPTVAIGKGRLLLGVESSVVRTCLDAAAGRTPSLAASPVRARVRDRLPETGGAWGLLDWNRTADQVSEYAALIAESSPPERLPDGRMAPEPPDNPSRAAWAKYERERRAFEAEAVKSRIPEIRKWIDAFRLIDHVAFGGTNRGRIEERRFVVRFGE